MTYRALYRVWRPQKFADVIGQEHITRTLQNALKERRFSHAYLFNGPRGTGKTSAAKILAKAINCENGPDVEPCNECKACQGITSGSVVDVVEIDAASNRGVEEIRDVREKVKFAPAEVRYKVYIIDEVHMLTTEAFNALLKTLEEPPEHVIFILATTEPHKLPSTIISRCQRFDFRRIPLSAMVERMQHIAEQSGVSVSEQALMLIARTAEGGMRDALSLLDQTLSFCGDEVELEDVLTVTGTASHLLLARVVEKVYNKDVSGILQFVEELIAGGKDPEHFVQDLIYYYRDILIYKSAPDLPEVKERIILDERFQDLANQHDVQQVHTAIEELNRTYTGMKWSRQPRILLEMALVKLCGLEPGAVQEASSPPASVDQSQLESLQKRIDELEEKIRQLSQPTTGNETVSSRPKRSVKRGVPPTVKIDRSRMEQIAGQTDGKKLQEVKSRWADILNRIKQIKVQVHAWLIDGEPVAATSDEIVVSFKSAIHRETTEKPENKQIIEDVLQSELGRDIKLLTLMENQWKQISEELKGEEAAASEEPEPSREDPLVEEAKKLFGEDLIDIKE